MEPLSALPQPGPVRPVPPALAAGLRPSAVPATEDVGVECSRRPDGVQVMTFVDVRTGAVISQTPAAQVLAVVDSVVAAIARREA
jgi:hypothetical protein